MCSVTAAVVGALAAGGTKYMADREAAEQRRNYDRQMEAAQAQADAEAAEFERQIAEMEDNPVLIRKQGGSRGGARGMKSLRAGYTPRDTSVNVGGNGGSGVNIPSGPRGMALPPRGGRGFSPVGMGSRMVINPNPSFR